MGFAIDNGCPAVTADVAGFIDLVEVVVVLGAVVFVLEVPQADCANSLVSSFKSKLEEKTVGSTLLLLMAGETTWDPARNSNISPRLELDSAPRLKKRGMIINKRICKSFGKIGLIDMRIMGFKLIWLDLTKNQ